MRVDGFNVLYPGDGARDLPDPVIQLPAGHRVHEFRRGFPQNIDAGFHDDDRHERAGHRIEPRQTEKTHDDAGAGRGRGENIIAVVPGQSLNRDIFGPAADDCRVDHQAQFDDDGSPGHEESEKPDRFAHLRAGDKIKDGIDRVPENRDAGRNNESPDNNGRDAFQLVVPVGMFLVRRFVGLFHQKFYENQIDDIGNRVDPVGEERLTVSRDAENDFNESQNDIREQSKVDHCAGLPLAFLKQFRAVRFQQIGFHFAIITVSKSLFNVYCHRSKS